LRSSRDRYRSPRTSSSTQRSPFTPCEYHFNYFMFNALNSSSDQQSRIASDLAVRLPEEIIPELSFIYFPQLGYLIRTAPNNDAEYLEECARYGFEYQGSNSCDSSIPSASTDETRVAKNLVPQRFFSLLQERSMSRSR